MEATYCVYKHTAPNGKVYIGQTMQNRANGLALGMDTKDVLFFITLFKNMVGKILHMKYCLTI